MFEGHLVNECVSVYSMAFADDFSNLSNDHHQSKRYLFIFNDFI